MPSQTSAALAEVARDPCLRALEPEGPLPRLFLTLLTPVALEAQALRLMVLAAAAALALVGAASRVRVQPILLRRVVV